MIYISHDHSYAQQPIDKEIISYSEVFYSPYRHYVESGIGDTDNLIKELDRTTIHL